MLTRYKAPLKLKERHVLHQTGERFWTYAFEWACAQNDVDHRLTKPKYPRPM